MFFNYLWHANKLDIMAQALTVWPLRCCVYPFVIFCDHMFVWCFIWVLCVCVSFFLCESCVFMFCILSCLHESCVFVFANLVWLCVYVSHVWLFGPFGINFLFLSVLFMFGRKFLFSIGPFGINFSFLIGLFVFGH